MTTATKTTPRTSIKYLILTGLFAALTAVFAWISIPLPFTPVPIVLSTLGVTLAGGLLGPKYGTLSMVVYVLLGAVGAPVFHNFTGGLGILTGPTGGYLIGYISYAFLTGFLVNRFAKKNLSFWNIALASIIGLLSCYLLGTAWIMISAGLTLPSALMLCIVPFIPGDLLKTVAAVLLIKRLRPALQRLS